MHSPAKGARHVWRLVLSQPHPTTKIRLTNYHPFSLTLPLCRAAEERVPHNFQFNFFNCISYAFFFTSAFDNSPNSVLLPASLLLQKVEDFRAIFKYNRSAIIFYSACYRCITWVQQSTQREVQILLFDHVWLTATLECSPTSQKSCLPSSV